MKKLAVLLALVMTVLCLTGCGKDDSGKNSGQNAKMTKGEIITFGHYEQDNNLSNGVEPIEWIVLDVQDGKALLLSRYALDAIAYHSVSDDITWENCTLRRWLNNDFRNSAFSAKEQQAILTTDVDNSNAQGYGRWNTDGGNNTRDRIFLLSYHEAFDLYFSNDEARMCVPTDFAVANGAWTSSVYKVNGRKTGAGWLRSPGCNQSYGAIVDGDGSRGYYTVSYDGNVIRPALWVNLNSDIF